MGFPWTNFKELKNFCCWLLQLLAQFLNYRKSAIWYSCHDYRYSTIEISFIEQFTYFWVCLKKTWNNYEAYHMDHMIWSIWIIWYDITNIQFVGFSIKSKSFPDGPHERRYNHIKHNCWESWIVSVTFLHNSLYSLVSKLDFWSTCPRWLQKTISSKHSVKEIELVVIPWSWSKNIRTTLKEKSSYR